MRSFGRELVWTLAVTIVLFLGLRMVVGSYAVVSDSMEPGLEAGERLLINKMAYKFDLPERGDVVFYKSPEGGLNQMKRVIGIPGDIVEIEGGVVYLNGHELDEPYVDDPPGYTILEFQLPPNSYFVLGDNRNDSFDSSSGWTVPSDNILGKAWILTWPPDQWGSIDNYNLSSQLATVDFLSGD